MENKPIYKTAAELGIQQWEHDGLVGLIAPLSRDNLRLNMRTASLFDSCGTAHCIGGWLAAKRDVCAMDYVNYCASPALGALFYPGGASFNDGWWHGFSCDRPAHAGWDASAPQAARAIVNFLMTGDPQWNAVMAEG